MPFSVKPVANPHDPKDVKYHVVSDPVVHSVHDTEEQAAEIVTKLNTPVGHRRVTYAKKAKAKKHK